MTDDPLHRRSFKHLGDPYLLGIDDSTALLSVQGLDQSRAEDDSEDEEGMKGLHCLLKGGEQKSLSVCSVEQK